MGGDTGPDGVEGGDYEARVELLACAADEIWEWDSTEVAGEVALYLVSFFLG